MSGNDEQPARQIERTLQTATFDRTSPGDSETLSRLFSGVNEFLAHPAPAVRSAAEAVAAISKLRELDPDKETQFRLALISLRESIEAQGEKEDAANQFANDPELVQEFLVESREHLAGVEKGILTLERDPEDSESLNSVFRSFHTIKGLAGFIGASSIHELAHETENVLALARSGTLSLSPEVTDLILRAADELSRCLDKCRTQNLSTLSRCDESLLAALASAANPDIANPEPANEISPSSEAAAQETAAPAETSAAPIRLDNKAAERPDNNGPRQEGSVVRIDTAKLEYLIDMVGELVIAESMVRNDPVISRSENPLLSRNLAQLARVVQEVQKTSMSMRMVAVGSMLRKMSRLTRDLARKSGKSIELVTIGDDVELDRNIVDELAGPLVHMIRNAVDHGLENAAERLRAGKPEKGTIRLQVMHDAGEIVIEIGDDGRGMDPQKILARARRLGMVGEQETLDEESIFRLIFEPGFSTVDKVTNMSGRGVGMDVVRKQIQKLRGRITIRSTRGQGCAFVLRLPLTLAIIDGLVVGVNAQRFVLPMCAVREIFSPKPDTFVTLENGVKAAQVQDKLLPIIRLSRLFESGSEHREGGLLIVAEGGDQLFCIAVDQLLGRQKVMIKSPGRTFHDVPAISGGAILGDGRVGLIIDVNALRHRE